MNSQPVGVARARTHTYTQMCGVPEVSQPTSAYTWRVLLRYFSHGQSEAAENGRKLKRKFLKPLKFLLALRCM